MRVIYKKTHWSVSKTAQKISLLSKKIAKILEDVKNIANWNGMGG